METIRSFIFMFSIENYSQVTFLFQKKRYGNRFSSFVKTIYARKEKDRESQEEKHARFGVILSNEGGKYLKKEEHGMKCKFIGTRHDLVFYMFKNIRVFSSVNNLLLLNFFFFYISGKQHLHIGIVKQCAMIFKNYQIILSLVERTKSTSRDRNLQGMALKYILNQASSKEI